MAWSKRRTVWLSATLFLVVTGSSLWAWQSRHPPPPTHYVTRPVLRSSVTATATATGILSPRVSVTVGSQVSGRIVDLNADFNQGVTRGQVLARLDPHLFAAEVARAEANLALARASLVRARAEAANARTESARSERLVRQSLVSQQAAEAARTAARTTRTQVASARAALAQATAALDSARTNLAYTTITSPIDGIVITRSVDVGQTVAASFAAPTLFTLAGDLREMELHTSVAESDVGRLAPGQRVFFTVDAFISEVFEGVVKEVRFSPQTVQNVVTYDAVVTVDNPDRRLRPGMTADVRFLVDERRDVLVVPNAALRFTPPDAGRAGAGALTTGDHSARRVWRLGADGRPEPVTVRIGISDGRNTELLEGSLTEDDAVITGIGEEDPAAPTEPQPEGHRPFRIL